MNETLVAAIRGPILLIALGLLFLADQVGSFRFTQTWPALIILFGALKLLERTAPGRAGGPGGR